MYNDSIELPKANYYLSNGQYNYKIMQAYVYENQIFDIIFENGERRFVDLGDIFPKINEFEICVNKIIFDKCYELSSSFLFLNSVCYKVLSGNSIIPCIKVGHYFGNYTFIIKYENGEIRSYNVLKILRGLKNFDFDLNDEKKFKKRFIVNEIGISDSETYVVIDYEEIYKNGVYLICN